MDYGDGSGAQPVALSGKTFRLSHTYREAGRFTVTVRVADDDGGVGVSQAAVVVNRLQDLVRGIDQGVEDLQSSGALNPPTANSLSASLDAAIAKLDAGDYDGALNNLKVFIGKVEEICGRLRTPALEAERAILLFSNPSDVLRALKEGMDCAALNIGGMHFVPGKRKIMDVLAVNDSDLEALREISGRGVKIDIQTVPTQRPVSLEKILNACAVKK